MSLFFWFFQKSLPPVPSFSVTPFRFCLFRICVILWVFGLVFASTTLRLELARLDTRLANYLT